MDQELSEEHQQVRDAILAKVPEDAEPLFIGIAGSRAKHMNSPGSDFDCKVIVKYPRSSYMLQAITATRNFKTEVKGIEVEGQIMDALTMIRYSTDTNPTAYDTFSSIPVFETETSNAIKQFYLDSYHPRCIQDHAVGMLANYRNKNLQDPAKAPKHSPKKQLTPLQPGYVTNLKLAGESIYLCLKVIFTQNNKQLPPPFKINELLEQTEKMLDADTKKWIDDLVEARMKDKTAAYETTAEFCQFVDKCMQEKRDDKDKEAN